LGSNLEVKLAVWAALAAAVPAAREKCPSMPRLRGIMSNLSDRSGDVKPERFSVLRFCFSGGRDILVCLMSDARRFPPPWSFGG
jgi:hypothetical protein